MKRILRSVAMLGMATLLVGSLLSIVANKAEGATPIQLDLKVLLVGSGSADPTSAAWASALTSEGVPFTEVTASGAYGAETVTLPTLPTTAGSVGPYNGVVIADSPAAFAAGQLTSLFTYETLYGVRQIDGYTYPYLGITDATAGALDGTTGTLTTAGLAALPELTGPVPFDTGTYGYGATVNAGAPFTPWLDNAAGQVLAGVYQHPSTDPQANVSELELDFDYNANQLQFELLAPGLINWVTADTHLGLYRNYFGQDVDDNFISDNEWSSQYQCTPGATDPVDYTCPVAVQGATPGSAPGVPADVQMSAADVAYVVNWEAQTGIKLNMAFNGIGACTAPVATDESSANCTGSVTDPSGTYTDPGQVVDPSYPNDQGLVNALLADKADFNWINHTWSHQFLGCIAWQPQALTSATPSATGGSLTAGAYNYEITAATAYGESEPSLSKSATVSTGGSVTLSWPDATNGTGTAGNAGPTLSQEEANHTGGTGFWGYDIYRENPGSTTYGLIGQVPEGTASTYGFTDTGATSPGGAPDSSDTYPTATNPGIDCSSAAGSWDPATSASPDASIDQEIGMNQAFAAANGLPNFDPSALVTGEHSGIENPNMPAALAGAGITAFASDASRQPTQYSETSGTNVAESAPRYPNNIYYNASTWADELNEYNTLYVSQGVSLGNTSFPSETGHCTDTSATTCITTPATQASFLASESHIMLSHILNNNPRVQYDHQTDLIGPDYTLLSLISNTLAQYNSWYNSTAPITQMTDTSEAQVLGLQSAWANAVNAGTVTASEQNGVVTLSNTSGTPVSIPVTVPPGTTVNGAPFGSPYGGQLSAWTPVPASGSVTLNENVAPTITSANAAASIVGASFNFTVTTTGAPTPAITETGALPSGLTFTDNGNGTATISGTPAASTGGSYPITIKATNANGSPTQSFTLTNSQAPTITSANTASFTVGTNSTYTITTTGYPAPTITEQGTLPAGLTFTDNGNGTGSISGSTTANGGTYPVTIQATNSSGSTATLNLTITVIAPGTPPSITSATSTTFTVGQTPSFTVTATGSPTPTLTETGTLPSGVTFTDNGNGTATVTGTLTAASEGTFPLTIKAASTAGSTTQAFTLTVISGSLAITSAASTTFTSGVAGSFTVTATGTTTPTITEGGALPAGLTFTAATNGTATISGTPAAADTGNYNINLFATNSSGKTSQAFVITVAHVPTITSAATATETAATAFAFTVSTTAYPTAALTETGALPSGVTFTDNGNGTASIAGTAAASTTAITIKATNTGGSTTQAFTLTVKAAGKSGANVPVFTSAASTSVAVNANFDFTVTTVANSQSATFTTNVKESGTLPKGVSFSNNGDGTADITGPATTSGVFPITITATNSAGSTTQSFVLTVTGAPTISTAASATAAVGATFGFSVRSTGSPVAALSETGSLPAGLTFTNNGDGTATIAGTPNAGTGGTYTLTITASNSGGSTNQTFVLTVTQPPAITSAAKASGVHGTAFTFTFTSTGSPLPTLTHTGTVTGLTWGRSTNGTMTLSGTPRTAGTYPLTVTATNSTGAVTQSFTLTVT